MNAENPNPPVESPISWRCAFFFDTPYVRGERRRSDHRDFSTRQAADDFQQQLRRDFPNAVASISAVYLTRGAAQGRVP